MKKLFLLTISIFFFYSVNAQNWSQTQKIVASDRDLGDSFGGVAISGNYAIVSATHEDDDVNGGNPIYYSGSVYIFEKEANGNWIEVQKIVASDRDSMDLFGSSVAICGNYAIVGAHYEDHDTSGANFKNHSGSAYIFERNSSGVWNEIQKITASDRDSTDVFGHTVSISSNYIIVGASLEYDALGMRYGAAYIFKRNTNGRWDEIQKLYSSDKQSGDHFGSSVSISGDYAAIGALGVDNSRGSVYIFKVDGSGIWTEKQKLYADDKDTGDKFGHCVSINDSYLIIGAMYQRYDLNASNFLWYCGAAYIFEKNGSGYWIQANKIIASDRASDDFFGISVSISGNYAIVGAFKEDEDNLGLNTLNNAGSAYIIERDTNGNWNQTQKIVHSDRQSGDGFGCSVAIDGNYILVGSGNGYNTIGGNYKLGAGSVYIFETPIVGISENDFNPRFNFFPNPTTGQITVDLEKTYKEIDIKVRNLLGQTVLSKTYKTTNQLSFEIKGAKGIYIVEIRADEGEYAVMKVVKE